MQTDFVSNKTFRSLRYLYALFRGVFVMLVVIILANAWLGTIFRVDGHSMDPTLHNGEVLPSCLLCGRAGWLHRNDIVIVTYAGQQDTHFVKRLIGLPGDTVQFQGVSLVLPAGQYFVEGDNRDHSVDSRVYGPISGSQIVAKVLLNRPLPTGL